MILARGADLTSTDYPDQITRPARARPQRRPKARSAPKPTTAADLPPKVRLALPVKLFLIAVLLPLGFQLGPLYLNMLRLVLLFAIVPLFFLLVTGRLGRLVFADYVFMLHLFWVSVTMFIHHPGEALEASGIAMVEFLGAYLLGRACIRSKAEFVTLCKWAMWLTAITLPFALIESQTSSPLLLEMINSIPGLFSYADVQHDPRMGLWRSQVVFVHPIHYGLFCSAAIPLTYIALRHVMPPKQRLIMTAAVTACCFLSLSSGALIAALLQGALVAWAFMFRKVERRWLYLIILFVVAYVVVDILSNRTPFEVFMSYAVFSPHNAYWRALILEWGLMNIFGSTENNIPAAPIFGIGLNDWVRPWYMHSGSMDNFWLTIGVRHGLIAVLLLVLGWVITITRIGLRDFNGDPLLYDQRRAWTFLFVGLSFTLSTVHIWETTYSYTMFLFGAGIWMLSAAPERTEESPEDNTGDSGRPAKAATASPEQRALPYSRFSPSQGASRQTTRK